MDKSEYKRMYELEPDFWWYRVLHELVEYTVKKYLPRKNIQLLDAGCGTGRMMEILQKYGSTEGIDYSEDAVMFANKRGLENVIKGDLNDYNFGNNRYDAIVCLDVLYHSGIQDDLEILKKFHQALKTEGLLIINLPAFDYLKREHDVVVHTKKRYRKKAFSNQLKATGFAILQASYRMKLLYFVILISKLFKQNTSTNQSESDLKPLPTWVNEVLLSYGRIENRWIRNGLIIPMGSSLFVVARK